MVRQLNQYAAVPIRMVIMKRLLTPWSLGVNAARHVAWYVSYQVNGETRPRRR
jgi:hypothetical protein